MVERGQATRSAGQAVLGQGSATRWCPQAPPLCDVVCPCWARWCRAGKTTQPSSPRARRLFPFRPPIGANQPGERGQETSPCLSFPIFKMGVLSPALA